MIDTTGPVPPLNVTFTWRKGVNPMTLPVLQGLVQRIDNHVIVTREPEILGVELDDGSLVVVRLAHPIMPHEIHRLTGRRVLLCFPGDGEPDTDEIPTHTEG